MEVENNSSIITAKEEVEEEEAALPGFRFHPTDEELVGFYLRRKVEKKPIRLELIKLVDIYKFDPWDLPKTTGAGEREWYFFCRRGRKYKNSIRPNRVTRSGFWKATGIDRPIYSGSRECIGLKKSLVYYRGSAGKGTKTEWMMHEFRLPAGAAHEAEVWTLCRILKRSVSYRKCAPDWREMAAAKRSNNNNPAIDAGSKTCSVESSCDQNGQISSYISFTAPAKKLIEKKPVFESFANRYEFSGQVSPPPPPPPPYQSYMYGDIDEFLRHADWEDLRSVVDCAAAVNPLYCDQFV